MKIAISSTGKDLDSEVSDVFGRCPYFLIVDEDSFQAIENTSKDQQHGAGLAAVKTVADRGAEAIITGNVGPRAMDVIRQFKLKVFCYHGKAKDAIDKWKAGELEPQEEGRCPHK